MKEEFSNHDSKSEDVPPMSRTSLRGLEKNAISWSKSVLTPGKLMEPGSERVLLPIAAAEAQSNHRALESRS